MQLFKSYQIEGCWNCEGKGQSIWDHLTHNHPEKIEDHGNGDSSAESYKNVSNNLILLHHQ